MPSVYGQNQVVEKLIAVEDTEEKFLTTLTEEIEEAKATRAVIVFFDNTSDLRKYALFLVYGTLLVGLFCLYVGSLLTLVRTSGMPSIPSSRGISTTPTSCLRKSTPRRSNR